jgi:Tfp pilus assembly PilM family ATPase
MQQIVGLDIGTRTVTGAVFSGSAKKYRLVDFFMEEVQTMGDSAQGPDGEFIPLLSLDEIIQKLVDEKGLKDAVVVVNVDTKDCIIREFSVPFTKDEQIRKMIAFEAEEHFHTLDVENVVLEYLKVGEANGKSHIIVVALRNEVVESRLDLLKKAEIDPIALDLDAAALVNSFALTPHYDPTKSALIIDMGANSAKIVLLEDGKLRKMRSLRTGRSVLSPDRMIPEPALAGAGAGGVEAPRAAGLEFGEYSIEARFQEIENALRRLDAGVEEEVSEIPLTFSETPIAILSDEDFEKVGLEEEIRGARKDPMDKLRTPPQNGSAGTYTSYLERIGAEIQRTFATTRSPIEVICLTGGMSAPEEARRYFTEQFEVDTVVLDLGGRLPADVAPETLEKVNRHGAVAVGLGLKMLGADRLGLDFRKGKFRYEHRFTRLRLPLLAASVLLVAIFFQTALWSYHDYLYLTERSAAFQAEMEKQHEAFFGIKLVEGRSAVAAAQEQKKKWQGKGVGNVGRVIDCVEAIRNFAEVMGATGLMFSIQSMNFDFKVKEGAVTGGKKAAARASADSTVDLHTESGDAVVVFENKFNKDPVSKVFDCRASPTAQPQGGYKINLKLTPKLSHMAKLE